MSVCNCSVSRHVWGQRFGNTKHTRELVHPWERRQCERGKFSGRCWLRGMLTRSHNEVINMFMNQINHTLTLPLNAKYGGPHPDSATGLCWNWRGEKSERAGKGLHAQTAFVSLCVSFDRHIKCVKESQVPEKRVGWGVGKQTFLYSSGEKRQFREKKSRI